MDPYRINVSDTHGRQEGRIETIDDHDVFYVERKPNMIGDVTEAQLQAAAAESGIRCVLLPLVAPALTQNGANAIYGLELLDHPDVISEGLYCDMVSANTFGIHMPFANMDGLYDLCGRLVGVPIRTDIYNLIMTLDEADSNPIVYPEEVVIMLMPISGYLASQDNKTLWKEKFFASHPDLTNGISLELDKFMPTQRMKDVYTQVYNVYGYLDVTPDVLEFSEDNSKVTIPVEMQGELDNHSIPDILAWINAVGLLKEDLLGSGELSDMTKFWLTYRAEDVAFPEPTEEEMHPWNPDEINLQYGLTNQEIRDLEEQGIYPPYPPELIPVEYGGTKGTTDETEENSDTTTEN